MKKQAENGLLFAWTVALVATGGSLYFSEVRQFEPCVLCWYQRIFMYPLVLLLAIGLIRKDTAVALYAAVFSAIGFCISTYHYVIQKLPLADGVAPSCGRVPCTGAYVNWFGFITIPLLAGSAFLIIFLTSLYVLRTRKG